MASNVNGWILKQGEIETATKLPVITIAIGKVSELGNSEGTIWRDENGAVLIATKEAPDGCRYAEDGIAVVRVIGGKVMMGGQYDIYVPATNKLEKLLSNPFDLATLPSEVLDALEPILAVASEVRPSIAPAEPGRKVIVITEEMVGEQGYINCHCPWDPEDVLTKLYPGDVFLVENEEDGIGYRIGKEEFAGTHVFE